MAGFSAQAVFSPLIKAAYIVRQGWNHTERTYIGWGLAEMTRRKVVLSLIAEWKEPHHQPGLLASKQHRQQILFRLQRFPRSVTVMSNVRHFLQSCLQITEQMSLGLDLQPVSTKRPLWCTSEP